ncbi:MAG: hypothetical protein BWY78_00663 [Alphaproteobacteria bacterium ADurb.Bin438]|nr:MAG: hypothetical protein BWY78_00663 [Alphaproteobacteria bacterium ADurb.Bin438]
MAKINIIGAGLSGLSCAVNLINKGYDDIHVFESSKNAGGRLKPFFIKEFDKEIYNPHLISGCNHNAFKFLEIIKADKLKKVKFKTSSYNLYSLYKLFMESVLNEPYEIADLKMGNKVLFKTLLSGFDFYLANPYEFIDKSVNYIKNNGGKFNYNHTIKSINEFDKKDINIIATDAFNLRKLLNLDFEIKESPIINVHFKYDLGSDFIMLCPDFAFPCVIFYENGVISITISACLKLIKYDDKNIINIMWKLIQKLFNIKTSSPLARIIKTKRATMKTNKKEIEIIKNQNIFICSDFLDMDLPSTIENSISSGFNIKL